MKEYIPVLMFLVVAFLFAGGTIAMSTLASFGAPIMRAASGKPGNEA